MKKFITALTFALLVTTSIASAHFDRSLAIGTSGIEVQQLQEFLATQDCFNHEPTGYFGFITLAGVKCFQAKNDVPTTGYFGVLSRAAANKIADTLVEESNQAQLQETGTLTNTNPAPTATPSLGSGTITSVSIPGAVATPQVVTPTSLALGTPYCGAKITEMDGSSVLLPNETLPISFTGNWSTAQIHIQSDQGYKANYNVTSNPSEWNRINPFRNGSYAFANFDVANYTYSISLDGNAPITGTFTINACPITN